MTQVAATQNLTVCTVISIVPLEIREEKPIYPGNFCIPRAKSKAEPEVLEVTESRFNVYLDADRGSLPVRTPATEVARAIVEDYINASFGVIVGEAEPGIFFVPGKFDKKEVLMMLQTQLHRAATLQDKWFSNLVRLADDDWQRYHQHKTINDLQRHACSALNLKRDWNLTQEIIDVALCPFCRGRIDSQATFCMHCRQDLRNPQAEVAVKK